MRLGSKRESSVLVCIKLFWRAINCANPIPKTDSQSEFLSRRGLGRKSPHIIWDYNIMTAIVIQLLTQPRKCKMGSSFFDVMSRQKNSSTTRSYFASMP